MAVPSSGQLREYADIGTELGVAQTNVSLRGMSQTAGFSAPDAMSEFYGYSAGSSPLSTVIYTGNGGTQSITGVGFQPDFVWIKSRNNTWGHNLLDSVRGNNSFLVSNLTNSEVIASGYFTFDSDGFTVIGGGGINANGNTFVAWCWKAGGAAVTNTSGSITSQVSANTEGGFSIVTYSGNSANGTVGHGLGVTPNIVLTKSRNNVSNWSFNGNIGGLVYGSNKILLNGTSGITTDTNEVLAANSSTFTAGASSAVGRSGYTYVAYCFAEKSGYSSFGSYTGSAPSTTTVTTGFTPSFVMIKNASSTMNWVIFDNKRDTTNPNEALLYPNLSNSEDNVSGSGVNFNSDGFTVLINQFGWINNNGQNYTYMAFA